MPAFLVSVPCSDSFSCLHLKSKTRWCRCHHWSLLFFIVRVYFGSIVFLRWSLLGRFWSRSFTLGMWRRKCSYWWWGLSVRVSQSFWLFTWIMNIRAILWSIATWRVFTWSSLRVFAIAKLQCNFTLRLIISFSSHVFLFKVELILSDHAHWNEVRVLHWNAHQSEEAVHPQISLFLVKWVENICTLLRYKLEWEFPGNFFIGELTIRQIVDANNVWLEDVLIVLRDWLLLYLDKILLLWDDVVAFVVVWLLEYLACFCFLV